MKREEGIVFPMLFEAHQKDMEKGHIRKGEWQTKQRDLKNVIPV